MQTNAHVYFFCKMRLLSLAEGARPQGASQEHGGSLCDEDRCRSDSGSNKLTDRCPSVRHNPDTPQSIWLGMLVAMDWDPRITRSAPCLKMA